MFSYLLELISSYLDRSESLKTLGVPRSKEWRKLRNEYLKSNPCCAVCGSTKNVVPHHIIPFHVDPSLELDVNNLITLCESKTFNCHLFFGHYKHYVRHNPDVAKDAAMWREKLLGFTNR